ncbi:MAG: tRNA (uridine(54)-C5)-methyltransferase TrmA [Arenicellales bacterium WSBS_2016_MAG_OTU3]
MQSKLEPPNPCDYKSQLEEKRHTIEKLFTSLDIPQIEVYHSEPLHYRMRAEFRIWHDGERSDYALYEPGNNKRLHTIRDFPQASKRINELMISLHEAFNQSETLRQRLYTVEFLTSLSGQAVVSMIYHKPLDTTWEESAKVLADRLNINLIGRSRKQKIVLGNDFIIETLHVEGKDYQYQQVETGFTQPNAHVNEKMLAWAKSCCEANRSSDLLELYCGNANFTIVLAQQFRKVLATEVSKLSVRSARYNCELNNIENIDVVRMSSEEFTQARNGVRPFRRLQDLLLSDYNFSTVFVDPPRAGLDNATLTLVHSFENIVYISCNPNTLRENLETLAYDYKIKRFAMFDQFPYTPHVECGVALCKKY